MPCTAPQNWIVPPQSSQSDCRDANSPAPTTNPSTSGSTNIPTATGRGERNVRYSPIRAMIQERSISEPNALATGAIGLLIARFAR